MADALATAKASDDFACDPIMAVYCRQLLDLGADQLLEGGSQLIEVHPNNGRIEFLGWSHRDSVDGAKRPDLIECRLVRAVSPCKEDDAIAVLDKKSAKVE